MHLLFLAVVFLSLSVVAGAHLFWWYYKSPQRTSTPAKPWPTVLWLQGGPVCAAASSPIAMICSCLQQLWPDRCRGNHRLVALLAWLGRARRASGSATSKLEIGPLDVSLQPRNSTWLQKADLIFVDNPVGVGYSYVENDTLLVTTDWEQAADATTLLKALVKEVPTLQSSPLFLVAESYGGKYAATLGASVARAVRAGELNITLGGVALGDSWISPEDFTLSYTPLLLSVSRLDDNAGDEANKIADTVKEQIAAGNFTAAEGSWNDLQHFIRTRSGDVDMYNFLDGSLDSASANTPTAGSSPSTVKAMTKYSRYLSGKDSDPNTLEGIMNGVIKEKLQIIPKDLKWEGLNQAVYNALVNDIMKPRIDEIDELLSYGVNVTMYNGQVPIDQPCIALNMIGSITQSPAS
ncbi:unnamed protein product [Urochloa decumbens]|uniref:Carboxypeptidase n=1 Tax=Urochloa decumbens TaxID=240449 RepID=A0ABC8XVC5_9POAL